MYYLADREKAARVLAELRSARLDEPSAVLACLQRLRNEVASDRPDDHARLAAWASIRKLYDAFRAKPESDLKPQWHEAITRTEAWHQSLR
jgi:hypothetical protein